MKLTVHHFTSVESTNKTAHEYVADVENPEGIVIVADAQTGGYGRMQRAWVSPPGNLYLSIILNPQQKPIPDYPQLAFLAGLAVYETLKGQSAALPLALKWPNDVLIDGKKVAGTLVEINGTAAIVGIGVNLASFPEDVSFAATSLSKHMLKTPTVENLLPLLLKELWKWYRIWCDDGFLSIRQLWLERAYGLNSSLTRDGHTGIFVGIDDDGALQLETADGVKIIR